MGFPLHPLVVHAAVVFGPLGGPRRPGVRRPARAGATGSAGRWSAWRWSRPASIVAAYLTGKNFLDSQPALARSRWCRPTRTGPQLLLWVDARLRRGRRGRRLAAHPDRGGPGRAPGRARAAAAAACWCRWSSPATPAPARSGRSWASSDGNLPTGLPRSSRTALGPLVSTMEILGRPPARRCSAVALAAGRWRPVRLPRRRSGTPYAVGAAGDCWRFPDARSRPRCATAADPRRLIISRPTGCCTDSRTLRAADAARSAPTRSTPPGWCCPRSGSSVMAHAAPGCAQPAVRHACGWRCRACCRVRVVVLVLVDPLRRCRRPLALGQTGQSPVLAGQ